MDFSLINWVFKHKHSNSISGIQKNKGLTVFWYLVKCCKELLVVFLKQDIKEKYPTVFSVTNAHVNYLPTWGSFFLWVRVVLHPYSPWQTETIVYRRRVTGSLEWPVGFWKFWSSSLPHPRGRALAPWRLNRAWLGMFSFGYLNKKQGHFKLTMLGLFII